MVVVSDGRSDLGTEGNVLKRARGIVRDGGADNLTLSLADRLDREQAVAVNSTKPPSQKTVVVVHQHVLG